MLWSPSTPRPSLPSLCRSLPVLCRVVLAILFFFFFFFNLCFRFSSLMFLFCTQAAVRGLRDRPLFYAHCQVCPWLALAKRNLFFYCSFSVNRRLLRYKCTVVPAPLYCRYVPGRYTGIKAGTGIIPHILPHVPVPLRIIPVCARPIHRR